EEPIVIAPPTEFPVPPSSARSVSRVERTVRLGPDRTLPSTLITFPAAIVMLPPAALAAPESIVVPEARATLPLTLPVIAPPVEPLELFDDVETIAVPFSARLPPTVSVIAAPVPEPLRFSA